jgi:hypothetical protein
VQARTADGGPSDYLEGTFAQHTGEVQDHHAAAGSARCAPLIQGLDQPIRTVGRMAAILRR